MTSSIFFFLTIIITTVIWPLEINSQSQRPRPQPLSSDLIYFGCNYNKGCFGSPSSSCIKERTCDLLATFSQARDSRFEFQMLGKMEAMRGYVALGLSKDSKMGSDSVFACFLADDGRIHVHEFMNGRPPHEKSNVEVHREVGKEVIDPSSTRGSVVDGQMLCEFTVNGTVDLSKSIQTIFNLSSNDLFILMARGPVEDKGQLGYHEHKIFTAHPVSFTRTDDDPIEPWRRNLYEMSNFNLCGEDRRCFGLPRDECIQEENCELLVAFKENDRGSFDVDLMGRHVWSKSNSSGYIAVGLSSDDKMGEDSVFGCYLSNGGTVVRVDEFYNTEDKVNAKVNRNPETKIIEDKSERGAFEDGHIVCHFTVKPVIPLIEYIGKKFNLREDKFHILLARGENANSDNLGHHVLNSNRGASRQSILLTDTTITTTTTQSPTNENETLTTKWYRDCGGTKGCFGIPENCVTENNCQILTTFHRQDDHFEFELMRKDTTKGSPKTGYVAVGLSSDDQMGDDSVFGCHISDDGHVIVSEYFNKKIKNKSNAGLARTKEDGSIVKVFEAGLVDGFLFCHFVIKSQVDRSDYLDDGKVFNLISDKVHLLLAKGEAASAKQLQFHSLYEASPKPISLADPSTSMDQNQTSSFGAGPEFILPSENLQDDEMYKIYEGCGNQTGCFGLPDNCIQKRDCHILVAFHENYYDGGFEFHLMSKHESPPTAGYVAVGFSRDDSMSSDSVFGCYLTPNGRVAVGEFYNAKESKKNSRVHRETNERTVTGKLGSVHNGRLFCSFSIQSTIDLRNHMGTLFKLNEEKVHILLARGDRASSDKLSYHPKPTDRGASLHAVSLKDKLIISGSSSILIELHGALMIIAWILLAPVGMFTARYFKQTFTDCTPKRKALWFWIHQFCMVTTVLLTGIAVVLIFVEVNGCTWENNILNYPAEHYHPILGLVLCCLSILQILIALFRPDPMSSKRIFFNWTHWIIATLAHAIALACIYLAHELKKTNLADDNEYKYAITIFVLIHLILHLLMSVHTYTADSMLGVSLKIRAFLPGPLRPSGTTDEYEGTGLRASFLFVEFAGASIVTAVLIFCICRNL